MSKKKIAIAAAGILVVAGAVAAVSAQGHRGGWHGMGWHGDGMDGREMRGRFGRALTKDEFDARARERFGRLDKNADNVIDAAEIETMVNDRMSRRHARQDAGDGHMGGRMMRAFDGNRDGKVSLDEVRAEFARRFAEADLNSDGKIDDADLPPMMRGQNAIAGGDGVGMGRGGRRGMMQGLGLLRKADANKDGVVTLDEVNAMAAREHARFDRNKDGVVDQADREALRKEMVEYAVKRFSHRLGGDANGRVTREQFVANANQRFARMDLNGDGTISRDERPGRRGGGHGWHHGRGHHDGMGPGHGRHRMDHDGDSEPGQQRGPGRNGEPPARN